MRRGYYLSTPFVKVCVCYLGNGPGTAPPGVEHDSVLVALLQHLVLDGQRHSTSITVRSNATMDPWKRKRLGRPFDVFQFGIMKHRTFSNAGEYQVRLFKCWTCSCYGRAFTFYTQSINCENSLFLIRGEEKRKIGT